MPSNLQNELLRILDTQQLTPHFQPIIDLTQRKIIGYEALIRGPEDSTLHSPLNLFETAERCGLSTKLEFMCREVTIKRYANLKLKEKLFINVSPSVLLEPEFKTGETLRFLDKFGVDPHCIIIELTEQQPTDDYNLMREAVNHYRSMGFQIALDDLGAGYSGLRLWSELLPEYVKIDKHFISGLHNDPIKFNFVRSIQGIASSLNCHVIAEGIETEEEFIAAKKLGISHAQGYYFARPTAIPTTNLDNKIFVSTYTEALSLETSVHVTAGNIAKMMTSISSATSINEVMTLFQQSESLTILPLMDNNIASGIIYRDYFLSKLFSSRYGIELYGKNPISSFLDNTPLLIDKSTPLAEVSKSVTSLMRNDRALIVTDNGEYAGIMTLLDLLASITQQQIQYAKHANPLTLLPGSVPINAKIDHLLSNNIAFGIGYFDLDNFKPFNDVYGYKAGDDMIKIVAELLVQFIPAEQGKVGHIGGDDFIVIFTCTDWLARSQSLLQAFESVVPSYYNDIDIKAGGIHTENRTGESCFFPLISLSVALISPESTRHSHSHVNIADLATSSKKMAKKILGNSYFVDQRIKAA